MQTGGFSLNLQNATQPSVGYNFTGTPTTSAIVNISTCYGCGGNQSSFDFGTAGTAIDSLFVVQNTGLAQAGLNDGATLALPFSYSTGTFPGGTGSTNAFGSTLSFCSSTLAANSACVLSLRYSGTTSATGTLTLNLSNAFSATATLSLNGTATQRALVTVNEGSGFFACTDASCPGQPVQFGPVASPCASVPHDFVVTNRGRVATTSLNGGTPLPFAFGYGSTGTGVFPGGTGTKMVNGIQLNYCTASLLAGGQCVVTINFAPPSGSGSYSGELDLAYSDGMGAVTPDAARAIAGTGD